MFGERTRQARGHSQNAVTECQMLLTDCAHLPILTSQVTAIILRSSKNGLRFLRSANLSSSPCQIAAKRGPASANIPKAPARDKTASPATSRVVGWRLWIFRLVALFAAPALFLGLVELGLRLAGFGYPTAFLLPATQNGQKVFVQNNRFGWRFLGPKLSRLPLSISISQSKAPDTVRIFVFGESAAQGDPTNSCTVCHGCCRPC